MRRFLFLFHCAGCFLLCATVQGQSISSPDNNITVTVRADSDIRYDVSFKGQPLMKDNRLSLTLGDGRVLGKESKLASKKSRTVQRTVTPLYGMASSYPDHCNELTLRFKNNFSVEFRVYNSGVAYRFVTALPGRVQVMDEGAEFNFPTAIDPARDLSFPNSEGARLLETGKFTLLVGDQKLKFELMN